MRKDPFKKYRQTTKSERIIERNKMNQLIKTERFENWIKWCYRIQRKECYYCDEQIRTSDRSSYHLEHKIPIYYGGKSEVNNLCLACPSCNTTKSTQQLIRNKRFLNDKNKYRILAGKEERIYL